MKRYALLGASLSHSFSKRYFDRKFEDEGLADCSYSLCERPTARGIRQWVEQEGINGFNVTIPFKREVMPSLDALSPEAVAIGAVNCVEVRADGRLVGYNTDAPAFRAELLQLLEASRVKPRTALVLGRGGAARAVVYVLQALGISCHTTDRKLRLFEVDCLTPLGKGANEADFDLLVNASPIGTWPNVDATPWPWVERLHGGMAVFDLVYNPDPTRLVREANRRGCAATAGFGMLVRQAELSWQIWNGADTPIEVSSPTPRR